MSAAVLGWSLLAAQLLLAVAMGCAVLRMLVGPRAQDRILALDTLYVNAAMLLARAALHRDRAERNPEVPPPLQAEQHTPSAIATAPAPRASSSAGER